MKNKCVPFLCFSPKTQQGFGIVKALVSIPLVLIGLVILAFTYTELNKAYWDYRVKELCGEDGGVTLFEYIELTPKEFKIFGGNPYGEIKIPTEKNLKSTDLFYITFSNSIIHHTSLTVDRSETKIIRRADFKVLSKLIVYGRGGGDLLVFDHPSHFSCRKIEGFNSRLIKSTVQVKGY